MRAGLKRFRDSRAFWPLMVLLAIFAVNGIITGGDFFKISMIENHLFGRVIDIVRNGSKLMLLSIGMTMVLATGGADISVGSVMAISSAVACTIIEKRILPGLNGSFAAAVVLAVIAGIACGMWNGFLVAKVKLQPIIATMILMVAGRGIAQLITDGKIVTTTSASYYFINGGYILGLPFPVYIVAVFLAAVLLFNSRSSFGLFLEATGCNSIASGFAGIRVDTIKLMVYAFSGMLAAIAGLIDSAGIKGADCNNIGLFIEMDAILSVAIGGTLLSGGRFSIVASIIGALIIQSITTSVLAMNVAPQATQVVKSVIVIAICLFQSDEFKHAVIRRRAGRTVAS